MRWPFVLLSACSFQPGTLATDAMDGSDTAGTDATVDAVPLGPWGTPMVIDVGGSDSDDDPSMTADGLEIFYNRCTPNCDIWVATRATSAAAWSAGIAIPELVSSARESTPKVTPNGLALYFESDAMSPAAIDIYYSTRATRASQWTTATRIAEVSSGSDDFAPHVDDAQLHMVLTSTRDGTVDLFESTRSSTTDPWSTPVALTPLNSGSAEHCGVVSLDRRTIYFASDRDGTLDLFVATRPDPTQPFGTPAAITELNSTAVDIDPWISADQRSLVFSSDRPGGGFYRLYESRR